MIALLTALQQRTYRRDHRIDARIGEFSAVHYGRLIRKRLLIRQRRIAEGGGDAVADISGELAANEAIISGQPHKTDGTFPHLYFVIVKRRFG